MNFNIFKRHKKELSKNLKGILHLSYRDVDKYLYFVYSTETEKVYCLVQYKIDINPDKIKIKKVNQKQFEELFLIIEDDIKSRKYYQYYYYTKKLKFLKTNFLIDYVDIDLFHKISREYKLNQLI